MSIILIGEHRESFWSATFGVVVMAPRGIEDLAIMLQVPRSWDEDEGSWLLDPRSNGQRILPHQEGGVQVSYINGPPMTQADYITIQDWGPVRPRYAGPILMLGRGEPGPHEARIIGVRWDTQHAKLTGGDPLQWWQTDPIPGITVVRSPTVQWREDLG